MRKIATLAIVTIASLSLFVLVSMPGPAWADSPHYTKGPSATLDGNTGDLTVSWKEAGLGRTPVSYTLTAEKVIFTFQCYTKSDNTPQGDPNSISESNVSVSTGPITPRNGSITASLSLEPDQGDASCTGHGLVLYLIRVEYDTVTFDDLINGDLNTGADPVSLGSYGPMDLDPKIKCPC